jgi:hypothetical protein
MRPAIDLLPGNVASIYNFNPSFAADLFFASSFYHLAWLRIEQKYRQ